MALSPKLTSEYKEATVFCIHTKKQVFESRRPVKVELYKPILADWYINRSQIQKVLTSVSV
jgi:hypothetical protein